MVDYLEASRQQLGLWEFLGRSKADEITALQMYSSEHPGEVMLTELVMPRIRGAITRSAHQHNQNVRTVLLQAQPIYWSKEMSELVHWSAPSFPTDRPLRPEDVPMDSGFMWFDEPQPLPELPDTFIYTQTARSDWLHGLLWFRYNEPGQIRVADLSIDGGMRKINDTGVYVAFIVEDPDTRQGGIIQGVLPWTFGLTIQDMVGGTLKNVGKLRSEERTTAKLQHALSAMLLMQQPIMRRARHKSGGDVRHLWQRTKQAAPEVEVVYLRRYQYKQDEEHEPMAVDWQCRWWVGPHWRTYHRGTVDEKTTFIYPYVKGPAGMPLKAPSEKILAVIR